MKVNELIEHLDCQLVTKAVDLDKEVTSGFIGDLLSVVMGKASEGCAWVTIQSHLNIVAVATLVDVACIIVSEGFTVEEDALNKANEEGVIILSTSLSSYQVAAKLSTLGIK